MELEKLKERLNDLFDEYQGKSLQIDDNQNSDYYLYIGKASAIRDLIDEIEGYNPIIQQDKQKDKCNHKESYFVYESNRKMHYERCCNCHSFLRESKDGINYIEFKSL